MEFPFEILISNKLWSVIKIPFLIKNITFKKNLDQLEKYNYIKFMEYATE